MNGILEFKKSKGTLKYNVLDINKSDIDFRKLIGSTYDIAYYRVLMDRKIILVVDDNGYIKNLETTFILGKSINERIKIYSDYEFKGNVYMAKINEKNSGYEFDVLTEDDIKYVLNKIYKFENCYILAVQ